MRLKATWPWTSVIFIRIAPPSNYDAFDVQSGLRETVFKGRATRRSAEAKHNRHGERRHECNESAPGPSTSERQKQSAQQKQQ